MSADAFKEELQRLYDTTSENICGVAHGIKTKDGKNTDTVSIIFYVTEKKPESELPVGEVLPKTITIDGVEYPTDVRVVEEHAFLAACHNPRDQTNPEIARLQGQAITGALVPMRGGQEIMMFPVESGGSVGTLGFFAIDNLDNRVVGVTNTHVVIERIAAPNDTLRPLNVEVLDPHNTIEPRMYGGNDKKYPTGALLREGVNQHLAAKFVKRYVPYYSAQSITDSGDILNNKVDAALLIMNDGTFTDSGYPFVDDQSYRIRMPIDIENGTVQWTRADDPSAFPPGTESCDPAAFLPFATTAEIDALPLGTTRVYSTGRTSGPKGYCPVANQVVLTQRLTVGGTAFTVSGAPFTDLLIIERATFNSGVSLLAGDSGSALLAMIDGRLKIIGICFAGPASNDGSYGAACRIDNLVAALNIRAWDETYAFSRTNDEGSVDSLQVPVAKIITRPLTRKPDPLVPVTYGQLLSTTAGGETYWVAGCTIQSIYSLHDPIDIVMTRVVTTIDSAYNAFDAVSEENTATGTTLATLSTVDIDNDSGNADLFTYALVAGAGSTDNASFSILGNTLRSAAIFDYETKTSYSIRIKTTDSSGRTFQKVFSIGIIDDTAEQSGPTDIFITKDETITDPAYANFDTLITENNSIGVNVAMLTATADNLTDDTFTYTLVAGTGAADNAAFQIAGNALFAAVTFDYETKTTYSIRVRAVDVKSRLFEKVFSVGIVDDTTEQSAPTDIILMPESDVMVAGFDATISENTSVNATIGSFDSVATNVVNPTYTYTFVSVPGSTDSDAFTIDGNILKADQAFDYETQSSYTIRVRTADYKNQTFEKTFVIGVLDVLEQSAPTDIILSPEDDVVVPGFAAAILENNAVGDNVGSFTSSATNVVNPAYTYAFVSGLGSTDNSSFTITGDVLKAAEVFDYETKSSYSVRVSTTDYKNQTYDKVFSIGIRDATEQGPPTDISISNASIDENRAIGTSVGTLSSAADFKTDDTFTYTLVSGIGSTDNASFAIASGVLTSAVSFDYETKNSYTVRIRTTDAKSRTFEKAFTISVNDLVEQGAPTDINLSVDEIQENNAVGDIVGGLTPLASDISNSTFTYTLVSGIGSTDNASFTLTPVDLGSYMGAELKAAAVFDYETKTSYSIRVRVTDYLNRTFEKAFTVSVTDQALEQGAPTDINLSVDEIQENNAVGDIVGGLTPLASDISNGAFTYALVSGIGSTDNASFTLTPYDYGYYMGATLKAAAVFDYETKTSYSIRVRITDYLSRTFEKAFTISVTDQTGEPTTSPFINYSVLTTYGFTGVGTADSHLIATGPTSYPHPELGNGTFTVVNSGLLYMVGRLGGDYSAEIYKTHSGTKASALSLPENGGGSGSNWALSPYYTGIPLYVAAGDVITLDNVDQGFSVNGGQIFHIWWEAGELLSIKKNNPSAASGDLYFKQTALILNGDSIADTSRFTRNVTAVGGAVSSTAEKKNGTGSIYLNGSGHIAVPTAVGGLNMDSDYVVEWWQYLTGTPGVIIGSPVIYGYFSIIWNAAGNTLSVGHLSDITGENRVNFTGITAAPNQWRHVAVSRTNDTVRLYIDGALAGTRTNSAVHPIHPTTVLIGAQAFNTPTTGYIDDLRWTCGTNRNYTGAIIAVPAAAHSTFQAFDNTFTGSGKPSAPYTRAAGHYLTDADGLAHYSWTANAPATVTVVFDYADGNSDGANYKVNKTSNGATTTIFQGTDRNGITRNVSVIPGDVITFFSDGAGNAQYFANVSVSAASIYY